MELQKKRRGFTLVELVVVIGIIAVLTTIVVANLSTAKAKSRDAQRIAAIGQVQLALEVYKQAYGTYPAAGCSRGANTWTGAGTSFGTCAIYIAGLTNILKLPIDPIEKANGYLYIVDAAGANYKFLVYGSMETKSISASTQDYARYGSSCVGATYAGNDIKTYAVWQDTIPGNGAGSECW